MKWIELRILSKPNLVVGHPKLRISDCPPIDSSVTVSSFFTCPNSLLAPAQLPLTGYFSIHLLLRPARQPLTFLVHLRCIMVGSLSCYVTSCARHCSSETSHREGMAPHSRWRMCVLIGTWFPGPGCGADFLCRHLPLAFVAVYLMRWEKWNWKGLCFNRCCLWNWQLESMKGIK